MTTCIRNTKEVTKTITVTVNDGYTLHLTDAQAMAILTVFHRVGGNPEGVRGDVDAVSRALQGAGVKAPRDAHGDITGEGNIYL